MPNKNYIRSRAKEQQLVNKYRELGWFATRTPQSRTPIDVLAFRPVDCGHVNHFEAQLHQFKVSENRVEEKQETKIENVPFPVEIIWHMVPVKSKKWLAGRKVQRDKKKARLQSAPKT
jgi:hypothetical protein